MFLKGAWPNLNDRVAVSCVFLAPKKHGGSHLYRPAKRPERLVGAGVSPLCHCL